MIKEKVVFSDFLKTKELRLTAQREKVLEVFLGTDRHLSVEELYNIVKKKAPKIGQATVFRTLKLLCEADIAKEVDLGDRRMRYEHKYGHEHHNHLVCIRCGSFIETVDPKIEKLQDKLCKRFGFFPQRHKTEIFGICKKCSKKRRS